ncbi:MAG: heptosyltransferase [Candidatus Sumerlaeota bacterium]|nr:heptosyltransferase [Candidatus Sumerlaeota bacterium]
MTPSPISVVVLAGGRTAKLLNCVQSLAAGTRRPDELVVVDNDPSGETAPLLASLNIPFPVRRIEGSQCGFAELRNRGVEAAHGPFIAFLDDDCLADRFWLARLGAALETHDAVGGPVLPAQDLTIPADFRPEINWTAGISSEGILAETGGMIELPSTSNMGLRKKAWEALPFQEIGGQLDTPDASANYRVGREDAEWWRAVRRRGLRTAIARRALVFHDIDASRFSTERTSERAALDGQAHWSRENPREELAAAAEDVVHTPLRLLRDAFNPDRSFASARRQHTTWARRQWSLLESALDDPGSGFEPTARTRLLAGAALRLSADLLKPVVRGTASFAHHEFKRIRPLPSPKRPPRRITVVCYNFLGDAILGIPMLRQLRRAFPKAGITFLTGPAAAPIFEEADYIDHVVELPAPLNRRNPRDAWRVFEAVRDTRPDVIVVSYFHGAPPLGLFAATDAPVICWDGDQGLKQQLWRDLATVVVPKNLRKAEVAALLDLLSPLKVPTRLERPSWQPPRRAAERIADLMQRWGIEPGGFAVIPLDGTPGHEKFWPVDRWGAVARHLHEKHGLRIVFDGRRQCRWLYEQLDLPEGMALSTHGMLDTAELGALLAHARVCPGIDTGPQHLAQAVGTPTLTLFGPLDERRWGHLPRLDSDGDRPLPFRTLRAPDAPFDWLHHERLGLPADIHMQRITVEQVTDALDEMLDKQG